MELKLVVKEMKPGGRGELEGQRRRHLSCRLDDGKGPGRLRAGGERWMWRAWAGSGLGVCGGHAGLGTLSEEEAVTMHGNGKPSEALAVGE